MSPNGTLQLRSVPFGISVLELRAKLMTSAASYNNLVKRLSCIFHEPTATTINFRQNFALTFFVDRIAVDFHAL